MKGIVFALLLLTLVAAAPAIASKLAADQPAAGQPAQPEKKADEFFKKLDADADGRVNFEEFLNGWYKVGADNVSFKPEDVDVNKDGKVTWKELHIHFKKKFDEADTNKDGYLDKKEAVVLFNF